MKRISLAIIMASTLALAGCTAQQPGFEDETSNRINQRVNQLAEKSETIRRGGVVDAGRAFLGRNLSSNQNQYTVSHGKPFPAKFEKRNALEMVIPEKANLEQIQLLMRELTGLNVVIRTREQEIDKKIRINHKGPLSQLVRNIAAHYDLAWSFNGETITFDVMDTRSYNLPLPAANGNISAALQGVSVSSNSVSSNKNVTLDPWAEITTALESIIEEPGTITTSQSTGQITVFAPVSIQEEAAKIIRLYDRLYSRRIGLEITTFYVDTQRSAELHTDIGFSITTGDITASLGRGITTAMQGGIGVIPGSRASGSFNLRNLAASKAVTDYQMSNTVAQNGVVAPVVLTNSQGYVSEIQNGGEDQGPSVSTNYIDSGISIYSLPRLMANGKIHLSIWVTQAELNGLETFNTGTGFVQLPDSDQRAVEYTLIMDPGETLIMGGYEQERATSEDAGGLGGIGALGLRNNRKGETTRSRMVLMVRPTIIN